MSLPSILLAAVISTLIGAAFHLFLDGGIGRLVLYLVLAWTGFAAGHLLAAQLGWEGASLGTLHVGAAAVGSAVFLAIGHWLSLVQIDKK